MPASQMSQVTLPGLHHGEDLAVQRAAAVEHDAAALGGERLHIGFIEGLHGERRRN